MSLRNVNKDHLKEHASVVLATPELLTLPDHQNPLKFWTHHPKENYLADLTVFAEGLTSSPIGNWAGPFTGRPQLILQLIPVIQESCLGISRATLETRLSHLRAWWRLLDAVEAAAQQIGQPMAKVEDVRQLTRIHQDFAHRSGMRMHAFRTFLRIVNLTLKSLGAPQLYWSAPEDASPDRRLPPEEHTAALRIALKQEWGSTRHRWALTDRIRTDGFEPQTEEESSLLAHWCYFADKQRSCNRSLPTPDELRGGLHSSHFSHKTGLSLITMRALAFPDRWEADTAFHLCLSNTGWNPSVLFSLDVSQPFLRVHPRDGNRYLLTGTKVRAGGKEQPVSGLWKTTSGPGYIIKAWIDRTMSLREQLGRMLDEERKKYAEMARDGATPDDMTRQLKEVQRLDAGSRSVWLFVGRLGDIEWLDARSTAYYHHNGSVTSYLNVFIDRLNDARAARGEKPIEAITPSDFRDIFALYVWRASGGNILSVMRSLNHARLSTTEGYVDNNILNAERDKQARSFLDHLFAELGAGRLDITILAHLQRHGVVTKEMEQRLFEYRTLQLSRMGVACKDPFHPPKEIQSESANKRMCGPQRCLLCKQHAVILPESLSGIAMRVEELVTTQKCVPVETWLNSRLPEELRNGLDVLNLFPSDDVKREREQWMHAIANGSHRIPGLHLVANVRGTA